MISKYITLLYKIFFIGLLLQFFAFNIATFSLGLDASWMTYVRLWKELLILWLIGLTIFLILYRWLRRQIFATREILWLKLCFALAVLITIWLNHFVHQLPWWVYALAFKYDFLWFLILFAWFHSSHFVESVQRQKLIARYGNVLKVILLLALGRYALTFIKPGILKIFWYNNFIYEGTAGGQAPAVYYTHINQGLPRNSFLFERPTTWGFYLTAFFPLFYMLFLYTKKLSTTRARRLIYGTNILLTFSRAARWAWIIELLLLWILTKWWNPKAMKAVLIKTILPLITLMWVIGVIWYKQIFARQYSNTGHVAMIKKWIDMSVSKPISWRWAASAGPGSHRNSNKEWFNPENQFLQIFIEFGVIWFLPWFSLFLYLNIVGILPRLVKKHHQTSSVTKSEESRISDTDGITTSHFLQLHSRFLLAMSLWLMGLSASGMILHSFVDRMVVYPFMLMFGIVLYSLRESEGKIATRKSNSTE